MDAVPQTQVIEPYHGPRPCKHCGMVFTPQRWWSLFCSARCKSAAHNEKVAKAWHEFRKTDPESPSRAEQLRQIAQNAHNAERPCLEQNAHNAERAFVSSDASLPKSNTKMGGFQDKRAHQSRFGVADARPNVRDTRPPGTKLRDKPGQ